MIFIFFKVDGYSNLTGDLSIFESMSSTLEFVNVGGNVLIIGDIKIFKNHDINTINVGGCPLITGDVIVFSGMNITDPQINDTEIYGDIAVFGPMTNMYGLNCINTALIGDLKDLATCCTAQGSLQANYCPGLTVTDRFLRITAIWCWCRGMGWSSDEVDQILHDYKLLSDDPGLDPDRDYNIRLDNIGALPGNENAAPSDTGYADIKTLRELFNYWTDGAGSMRIYHVSSAPIIEDPTGIPNLVAWFDADLGVTGDPVDQLDDQSGNDYHATSVGASRPTVAPNAISGHDALLFDGSDDYLTIPRMEGKFEEGLSWCLVFQMIDKSGGGAMWGNIKSTGDDDISMYCMLVSSWAYTGVVIDAVNYSISARTFGDGEQDWCFISCRVVANDHVQVYFNGNMVGAPIDISGVSWNNLIQAATEMADIGCRRKHDGTHISNSNIKFASLSLFGRGLTDTEMESLHEYVKAHFNF